MADADYSEFIFRNGVLQEDFPANHYMGTGRVVASFHKNYPELLVDGKPQDTEVLRTVNDGWDMEGDEYFLELDGYRWQARHVGNMLDMQLVEPDGTVWQGRGGYGFGLRFAWDEAGGAEHFYNRVRASRFCWAPVPEDKQDA